MAVKPIRCLIARQGDILIKIKAPAQYLCLYGQPPHHTVSVPTAPRGTELSLIKDCSPYFVSLHILLITLQRHLCWAGKVIFLADSKCKLGMWGGQRRHGAGDLASHSWVQSAASFCWDPSQGLFRRAASLTPLSVSFPLLYLLQFLPHHVDLSSWRIANHKGEKMPFLFKI